MKNLVKIQNELRAPKSQRNNFGKYNYRSCEDVLEALKPLLKKYNCTLNISDQVIEVGGLVFIEATAIIKDGDETLVSKAQAGINPNRKGMDIAQSFGSSSSYARKYALNGLFLIDDNKDADVPLPQKLEDKGFKYLTEKGTLEQVNTALNERSLTELQEKALITLKVSLENGAK